MLRMPDGWHTVSLGVPPTSLWAWVPLATLVRAPYSVPRARGKNTKSGSEMTTKSKESRIKLDFCQYVSIFLAYVGRKYSLVEERQMAYPLDSPCPKKYPT